MNKKSNEEPNARRYGGYDVPGTITRRLRSDYVDYIESGYTTDLAKKTVLQEQAELDPCELEEDRELDKRPPSIRPISRGAAFAKLFPGQTSDPSRLHPCWPSEDIPSPPLPIDTFLQDLWRVPALPKVNLQSEYQQKPLGDLCFEARRWILLACQQAEMVNRSERLIRDDDAYIEGKQRQLLESPLTKGGEPRNKP